jgi:hypothetical protein
MRSKLTGRMQRYLGDASRAFERAPAEVTVAVVLAVALSYAIENVNEAFSAWLEIAAGCVIIVAAAWTGTLLHALGRIAARRRWAITLGGVLAGAAYIVFVADFEQAAEGWRAAMVAAAAAVWITAVPSLAADWRPYHGSRASGRVEEGVADTAAPEDFQATDRMRTVTGRFLLRVIGAALYCTALFAGLALAIGAVNALFELNLDSSLYAHVFGWIALVLGPWIVVGGLPHYVDRDAPHAEVAGVVQRMAAFLVPPLLALYYAILYAYAIRIALTGEVPKNLVSPLVFAAGVLAALGLLLFDPRSREATAFRTLRAAPPLFLPLAALGVWTIMLRVSQYGWTEFRLLRLLLLCGMALLALGATIQVLRRHRLSLHVVPLSLAALLLVSAAGPWSVQAVARRSQQARLDRGLAAVGIDPAVPARPSSQRRQVPATAYDDVAGSIRYLTSHFGPGALPPAIAAVVGSREDAWVVTRRLGLEPAGRSDHMEPPLAARLPEGAVIMLDGMSLRRVAGRSGERPEPGAAMTVTQDSTRLLINEAGEQFTADLGRLLALLLETPMDAPGGRRGGRLGPTTARLDVHDATGRRRGTLIVLDIFILYEGGQYVMRSFDGILLLEASAAEP